MPLALLLSACGDDVTNITNPPAADGGGAPALVDTDGDGLSDDREKALGTSPILPDTDADGFDDYEEVVTLGFDPAVNNLRFNPLIADLPQISVEVTSAPDISLNYTETNGTSTTVSTNRSQSSSISVTSSETTEESSSVENAIKAGVEIGYEVSVGTDTGVKASGKISMERSLALTKTSSTSKTEEQSTEDTTTMEKGEAFEKSHELSAGDGSLAVTVEIANTGHLTYSLQNLFLSATYYDPAKNNPFVPVGNLPFDSKKGIFPAFSLAPGQKTGPLNFAATELNLNTMKGLLRDSRGLSIRPAIFDLLDADGTPFNFNNTGIDAQTAMVLIDFGGAGGRRNLTKLIAVNGNPDESISVDAVLRKVLKLAVETTDANGKLGITALSGIANSDPTRFWVMVHGAQQGNGEIVTTVYTTPEDKARLLAANPNIRNLAADFDIARIRLHGGDILHLVYLIDDDLDGLGNRQEFFHGTLPQNPDTDGDDLTDGAEVRGWEIAFKDEAGADRFLNVTSDPTKTDTDGDGVRDDEEANTGEAASLRHRNPRSADTDGDGIPDGTDDLDDTGAFADNAFDPVDVTGLKTSVTPTPGTGTVTISYTVRDVTGTGVASTAGNGISDYRVTVFRQKNAGTGFAAGDPSPAQGLVYIVGDQVPCDNGAPGCSWEVADTGPNLPAPGDYSFVDPTVLTAETASFRYAAFVQVNGRYTKMPGTLSASLATETLEFHVLPGTLYNHTIGFQETDGKFDLSWSIWLDGNILTSNGNHGEIKIRQIARSFVVPPSVSGVHLVTNLPTEYDVVTETDSTPSGKDTFADPDRYEIDPVTKGSVFRATVPAEAGCHQVALIVREFEFHPRWNQYANVEFPDNIAQPKRNYDRLKLCREADGANGAKGIWTATPLKVNPAQPDLGLASLSVTRVGNINPISYKTRRLSWRLTSSPTQGDLVVPYKVFVKP